MTPARLALLLALSLTAACQRQPATPSVAPAPAASPAPPSPAAAQIEQAGKPVVYQLLVRLYGNKAQVNRPWGTLEENGVGRFEDIDEVALRSLRELGVTHVWYTGVPHHALIRDYGEHGIGDDDPDVVKGRAGSPYAVKDYYSVNPDLARYPPARLDEFRALVARSHAQGLKVITDIVPNHVARNYRSLGKPAGVEDFGARDDRRVEYARDNDFYYLPGQAFEVPNWPAGHLPLGGEAHPLADGRFEEDPAKWTGNGSRAARPDFDDWYETVKINFGVRPDGRHDFDELPADFALRSDAEHAAYWEGREVPSSWRKFREIALFWLELGVDGFRFDIAEMVPVAFWSYLNAAIRQRKPDAFLLAEIYNPAIYRDFVRLGRMDVLYDKVDTYDGLRAVIEGRADSDTLPEILQRHTDIDTALMRFLENHDEQRIASSAFAGDPAPGRPGMLVTAASGRGPVLVYFGQEVGEPAAGDAGFGKATRTTIFDYWGVPAHQRWMNGGRFDGGASTPAERELRAYYAKLLNFVATQPAMRGAFFDLHAYNREHTPGYNERLYAFARFSPEQRLLAVASFDRDSSHRVDLALPLELSANWHLPAGRHLLHERLGSGQSVELIVHPEGAVLSLEIPPLAAWLFELESLASEPVGEDGEGEDPGDGH